MKPFLLKALPLLGVALATTPAYAGSWGTIGLEYSGTSSGAPGWGRADGKMNWRYGGWTGDDGTTQGASTNSNIFGKGQTQSGSCSGHYILVLHYYPSSATDTIPPVVGVNVQQAMSAWGGRKDMNTGYYQWTGTPGSVTISAQVTAPDGTSYSPPVQTTKDAFGFEYNTLAQYPHTIITVSTKDATQQNGVYTVRHDLPDVKGTFSATMGDFWSDDVEATDQVSAGLSTQVNYALDPHSLYISSDIEKSWKKFAGPVDKLPDSYKQRDSSGAIINQPNGDAVLVYTDPTDATKTVWKIACQRNPDSSMTVHSKATKIIGYYSGGSNTTLIPFTKKWMGQVSLISNATGWTNPVYSWDEGSNTDVGGANYFNTRDSDTINPLASYALNIVDGKTLTPETPTTFKVTVIGFVTTLSNTYTVKWHKPLESYKDVSDSEYPRKGYKFWPTSLSACLLSSGDAIDPKATVRFNTTLLGRYEHWSNYVMDKMGAISVTAAVGSALRDGLTDAGIGSNDDTGEQEDSVNMNSQTMFDKAQEMGLAPGCTDFDSSVLTAPLFYKQYNLRHIQGDAYDKNGFTGIDEQIYADAFDSSGIAYGQGWTGNYKPLVK